MGLASSCYEVLKCFVKLVSVYNIYQNLLTAIAMAIALAFVVVYLMSGFAFTGTILGNIP